MFVKLHILDMKIIGFLIFIVLLAAPQDDIFSQSRTRHREAPTQTKPTTKHRIFPDEYSELDEVPTPSQTQDEALLSHLEKARQKYLQALILIENGDTTVAAKYFDAAIDILNRLVSHPGIELNEDFTDLAQSVIEDHETFIKSPAIANENSSLFVIREKLLDEFEDYSEKVEIHSIEMPAPDTTTYAGMTIPGQYFRFAGDLHVPLDDNEYVQTGIKFLTKNSVGRKFFEKCLRRSTKWFPMMVRIAHEEGVPVEIIYLSLIESGLDPQAVSSAKAVGMWQFMRATGELYDLNTKSSVWIDERRDPEKATRAAMRHLADLYNELGNWHLAFSAYNCGLYCVKRAIRRTGSENPDFWEVRKYLPEETRKYVPLYIATAKIALQPEAYGFDLTLIPFEEEFKYDTYTITEPVNLGALAKCAGISLEELRDMNPELVNSGTPPDVPAYELKIPYSSRQEFITKYSTLTPQEKQPWITHRVTRGETLWRIAREYGVSAHEIADVNGLSGHKARLKIGQELKIPSESAEGRESVARKSSDDNSSESSVDHVVRRGETLYSIARRYGVRVTDLRNWNDIPYSVDNISPGQRLIVAKSAAGDDTKIEKIKKAKIVRHKVKRGETLSEIAENYGATTSSIRNINRIRGNKIIAGQTLKIQTRGDYTPSQPRTLVHKVRRGESLGTISQRYGVSTEQLQKWNPDAIEGTMVFSGTRLKIHDNNYAKGSSSASSNPPKYYKIRPGDTLISIARKFGVSVDSIKRKNRSLDERRLQVGQRIRIQ
ncbi:MAG: LysM peptidoglycan-binding domain-containing protein [Bacteroidota bacterium]